MKKKIMAISMSLTLIAILAAPLGVYAADGTTSITGNVVSSYTFMPPTAISLGSMSLGSTVTGSNSGTLTGSDPLGYTVSAIDAKGGANAGYMVNGNNSVLQNKFKIGKDTLSLADSDAARILLDVSSAPNSASVPLYVSQQIALTDPVATGYTITITFTVTPK